ncbi:hypothetical protein GIB67_022158, partial [Kingdonia uniflora]
MATSGSAYDDIMEISAYVAETKVDVAINMAPPLKKQKQESGKDIRASLKGVNLKAAEQEALNFAKRDPIRLDTQIRSSISQLSVGWKLAAEVLKVAAADRAEYEAEKASLAEQLKDLVQAFYSWGLKSEDVSLAIAGKYGEIIFPKEDPSSVAERPDEQTLDPLVENDTTPEEVVHLRGKVIEMEKALSRERDSINRTQQ